MSLRILGLYYHSIKHLRLCQVVFRLYYKLRRVQVVPAPAHALAAARTEWAEPRHLEQRYFECDRVRFLGEEGAVADAGSWNDPSKSKLWLYNLHYFDDLNACGAESRAAAHLRLVHRWIEENPPPSGNGWESYPTSLRLVNWVKWCWREGICDDRIVGSVAQQADALSRQMEYHVLGNHLMANAKALVFAGLFLAGEDARAHVEKGVRVLRRQVREQFLPDGGHFELSPMYHAIVLWDVLDLINLACSSKSEALSAATTAWRPVAEKALLWLRVMAHPDGEISFFNDGAMGIAAAPGQVFAYGQQLGLLLPEAPRQAHVLLHASGYSRLCVAGQTALVDHAAVGASCQPGHAHADSLSFEWSVGQQRVLVNSGTSRYGVGAERLRQRRTEAHNTVVVDGCDSSEVWSGFRVARRARAKLIDARPCADGVSLVMAHDGYRRLPGRVTHEREIRMSEQELLIVDRLCGRFRSAAAVYHFHPDIAVDRIDERRMTLMLPSGLQVRMSADGPILQEDSTWHPRFGVSVPNIRLKVPFGGREVRTTFSLLPGDKT